MFPLSIPAPNLYSLFPITTKNISVFHKKSYITSNFPTTTEIIKETNNIA